jgi:antitoxin CptB
MIDKEDINRMRWAARRGMLELDLMLEPFVSARYAQLDETDRHRFQQLMLCEDQDLFAWLMLRGAPDDEELTGIVSQIRHFTRALLGHSLCTVLGLRTRLCLSGHFFVDHCVWPIGAAATQPNARCRAVLA